jgi:isopenicillin N synthase-like dioxygenase
MSTQIFSQVPNIDISSLFCNELDQLKVFEKIASACSTWGFFYIKNHPISSLLIKEVVGEAKAFFNLDKEEKHKVARFIVRFKKFYCFLKKLFIKNKFWKGKFSRIFGHRVDKEEKRLERNF